MNNTVDATILIKWQRVSIASLLLALLTTVVYSRCQLRQAERESASAAHRAALWQGEAFRSQELLLKERVTTEGLKSCMTFDQSYIHSLEGKLARSGNIRSRSFALQSK